MGIYGAKKAIAFVKAFMKARKEAPDDASGEVVSTAAKDDDEQDEAGSGEKEEATKVSRDGVALAFCSSRHA